MQSAASGDPFTFNWRKQDGTARQAGYYYTAERHVFPRLTRTSQLTEQMQCVRYIENVSGVGANAFGFEDYQQCHWYGFQACPDSNASDSVTDYAPGNICNNAVMPGTVNGSVESVYTVAEGIIRKLKYWFDPVTAHATLKPLEDRHLIDDATGQYMYAPRFCIRGLAVGWIVHDAGNRAVWCPDLRFCPYTGSGGHTVTSAYPIPDYYDQYEVCLNRRIFEDLSCTSALNQAMHVNPDLAADRVLAEVRQAGFCTNVTQLEPFESDTICHTIAMSKRGGGVTDGMYSPVSSVFVTERTVNITGRLPLTAFNGTAIRDRAGICGSGTRLLFINCDVANCSLWALRLTPFVETRQEGFVLYHLFDNLANETWRFTTQTISVEMQTEFKTDYRASRRLIAVWSGSSRGLGMKGLTSGVPAAEGEFSSVVALSYQTSTGTARCSGTVVGTLAAPWLLTAKHCIDAELVDGTAILSKLTVFGCGQASVLGTAANAFV